MAVAGMAATGKSNGKPLPWTDDPYERLNYVPIEPYKLDSIRDRIPQKVKNLMKVLFSRMNQPEN